MLVGDLTESQILERIVPNLPKGRFTTLGPGDDCAEVRAPSGSYLVTADILVEGQHFLREWMTGYEVGGRACAQNLADVAAMGAYPTDILVSLVLPRDLQVDWLEDLARGIGDSVGPLGVGVVGGDITVGPVVVVSITAHGTMEGPAIKRSGATVGDTVAVAGTLGFSAAGLAALQAKAISPRLHGDAVPEPFTDPVAIFRVPRPPLEAGPLAAKFGASAMMDISDGLAMDAGRLGLASGVSICLDGEKLAPDVEALSSVGDRLGVEPMRWILGGGEDHSLLATFPDRAPYPFRKIGIVGPPREGNAVFVDDVAVRGGWDPFIYRS